MEPKISGRACAINITCHSGADIDFPVSNFKIRNSIVGHARRWFAIFSHKNWCCVVNMRTYRFSCGKGQNARCR